MDKNAVEKVLEMYGALMESSALDPLWGRAGTKAEAGAYAKRLERL
ncbi:MAG: hypothetical protein NVSMB6_01920 [Burkholderiaceae bacterium]